MATGNPYFSAVQQTLPEYIPMPLNELAAAGQVMQNRYDTNMQQLDQIAQGIGSIQAYLPDHREYVQNYSNNFNQESEALLEKYNNNAADPNFGRDLRRLTMKYTNDPNIRTIQQANALYLQKQEDIRKLSVEGKRFIDSNMNPTGTDSQGNLIADVGSVRATNFHDDLRTMFRDTLQATINDGRGRISNETAVANTIENLMAGGTNNPVLREGMEYYMSQGMSPEEAQQQLQLDIQREASSALTSDRDSGYFSNQIARERLNFDIAKEMARQDRAGAIVSLNSPIEVSNLNKDLIKETDSLLKSETGFSSEFITIPNTPENRQKYPNAEVVGSTVSGGGTGAPGVVEVLRISNEDAAQAANEFVESARMEIGNILNAKGIDPQTASREQVLSTYKEYLQADNNAPTFWTTPVYNTKRNITSLYIGDEGQHLNDAIIVDGRGNTTRVASDKKVLNDLTGFDFAGITASPIRQGGQEFSRGALKGTAVDGKGNIVTIYKPLPPMLEGALYRTNAVDRAITSGLTNKQLERSPAFIEEYNGVKIVPQKKDGKIEYYMLDNNGNITGKPLTGIQEQILEEKKSISNYFSIHQTTE